MGRPREHDEHTRDALLDAAEELLEEGGEAALSVRAVADRIGTSTRAVYSLFGSKERMLYALGERGWELLSSSLDQIPATDDPIADIVRGAMEGFRRWYLTHPELFRLAFDRLGLDNPDGQRVVQAGWAALGRLRARVQRAHDAGLLANRDVNEVTAQFNALCEGLAKVERRGGPGLRDDPERIWRDALHALLAGMRTPVP